MSRPVPLPAPANSRMSAADASASEGPARPAAAAASAPAGGPPAAAMPRIEPPAGAPSPTWSPRKAILLGIVTLTLLVGGFGGWAVFTHIAGAIIASGQIEVDQNRQVVQHLDGGVVSDILVQEGDTVAADETLIRLDGSMLSSELAIVEGQLYELIGRRGRLEAERDGANSLDFDPELLDMAASRPDIAELVAGQQRLFEARVESIAREVEQLGKRRSQIGNQIEGITAQQDALAAQLDLLQEELADQQQLMASGLAQKSRVLALQREEARLSGTLGELVANRAESEGRMTEIDIEILKLTDQRREDAITRLRDLRYQEYELAEQRRSLKEQIDRLDVRAPVGGIVYGMEVFAPRSVIRAADPVLYIIPQDRPLLIASRVEPIHVDQVYPGQEVTLRFSALDARITPELQGRVTKISADAFSDDARGTSFYRAEIVLMDGEMEKLPPDTILLPGMPVEAFLRTSDRTPLAYLVKPLSDYFTKAFREG